MIAYNIIQVYYFGHSKSLGFAKDLVIARKIIDTYIKDLTEKYEDEGITFKLIEAGSIHDTLSFRIVDSSNVNHLIEIVPIDIKEE